MTTIEALMALRDRYATFRDHSMATWDRAAKDNDYSHALIYQSRAGTWETAIAEIDKSILREEGETQCQSQAANDVH